MGHVQFSEQLPKCCTTCFAQPVRNRKGARRSRPVKARPRTARGERILPAASWPMRICFPTNDMAERRTDSCYWRKWSLECRNTFSRQVGRSSCQRLDRPAHVTRLERVARREPYLASVRKTKRSFFLRKRAVR